MLTVTVMFTMLLGTSYAWYQFDYAVTPFNNVQTFEETLDDLAIVFTNSNNIKTSTGIPITSSQVEDYAEKTNFTITPSSAKLSGKEVAFQIDLTEINIDKELTMTRDLKWQLFETIGTGTKNKIAEGEFFNANGQSLVLKSMTKITTFDITYSYEFRIWLQESGGNQNNLMGKSLSGKIIVSSAIR